MIIERIQISLIRLPFRFSYGHKQKTHKNVFAVICQVTDDKGSYGLGEAVPRTYVTGESAESAFFVMQAIGEDLLGKEFTSYNDVQIYMADLAYRWRSPFPSCAFCAIDLALHDCMARSQDLDMAAYLGAESKPIQYTGSLGISDKTRLLALLSVYRLSGINTFKLKVGDDDDLERLKTVKNFMGADTLVFADANGAWSFKEAPEKINRLAEKGIWAIEEPLHIPKPPNETGETDEKIQIDRDALMDETHYEQYARLRKKISIPVILDESLISPNSFNKIVDFSAADILNIRLSKLGGYSLVPGMLAGKPDDMKFSLCAMVGESPILAAAGYFFGCAHTDHLYMQGYSHRILHGTKFTRGGPIMRRGKVFARKAQTGFGISIKQDILKRLTLNEVVLTDG